MDLTILFRDLAIIGYTIAGIVCAARAGKVTKTTRVITGVLKPLVMLVVPLIVMWAFGVGLIKQLLKRRPWL